MSQVHKTKVAIIGSGPAGYTAAIYTSRANLQPILISGYEEGGQLTITTDVENYPGFAETIQGPWLMEQMKKQAENVGSVIITDFIQKIDFTKNEGYFTLAGDISEYKAQSVVICTGAQAKWLGIESETHFKGFGVSGCATCDGFFYKGKNVIVVGGGNTAAEEALYLTNHAERVYLVHRRNKLRSERILQDRLLNHSKITPIWNSEIEEILGNEKPKFVKSVKLKNTQTQEITEMSIDGVFIAIGHKPATGFLANSNLELDEKNYIKVAAGTTKTNIEGVFAAGDVSDKHYRQAVTAAGLGCMAALDALQYIDSLA